MLKQGMRHRGRYIGRLAPTPSGLLHKGHAFTFGIAYYRARYLENGKIYLRLEDLDRNRCKAQYAQAVLEDLRWLGLDWDPHPGVSRNEGVDYQSTRLDLYRSVLKDWANNGLVYPCSVTRKQLRSHRNLKYSDHGEALFPEELRPKGDLSDLVDWDSETFFQTTWRWRVAYGEKTGFHDARIGEQELISGVDYGDFLVWSREGFPSYETAVVLDDIRSGITEVVRGEDLLVSTARQLRLYRALGSEVPTFYHCPLVRDKNGVRLAKSFDSESIRSYRERGYHPADFWFEMAEMGMSDIAHWLSRL